MFFFLSCGYPYIGGSGESGSNTKLQSKEEGKYIGKG
jgi:hypothetical protein